MGLTGPFRPWLQAMKDLLYLFSHSDIENRKMWNISSGLANTVKYRFAIKKFINHGSMFFLQLPYYNTSVVWSLYHSMKGNTGARIYCSFMARGLRLNLTAIRRCISYSLAFTNKSENGFPHWETRFPIRIYPASRPVQRRAWHHSAVTPSTLPYFDAWEEPLCLPPWPLADLPLPADRALNIASPPVEMSEE